MLVLIRGDHSDNLNCFLLSVHPVSLLNSQITFDGLGSDELAALLEQFYGSIDE